MQNKPKRVYIGAGVPQEDYDWLVNKAKEEDRSITSLLRRIIKAGRELDEKNDR